MSRWFVRYSKQFCRHLSDSVRSLSALKLVWQSSPKWTLIHVSLLLLQSGLSLAGLYTSKWVVDLLALGMDATHRDTVIPQLLLLFGLAGTCLMLSLVCSTIDSWVTQAQGLRLTEYMQARFYAKAITVDIDCYENTEYYNILQRAQREVQRPTHVMYTATGLVQNGLSLITMSGLLATIHWVTLPALALSTLPTLIAQFKYGNISYQWERRSTQMHRQIGYLGSIVASDSFAKELRLFNLGPYFMKWVLRLQKQLHREKLAIDRQEALVYIGVQAIGAVLMLALYGFIVLQALNGALKLGDLVLYHQALQRGKDALQAFVGGLTGLHENYLFLCNLDEFFNLENKLTDPPSPQPVPQPLQQGIVFHQVDFQYAHSQRQALQGIDLAIRPGEVVALVGANGSGKTTLIKLLCRLYEPTAGQITWDGIDVRNLQADDLHRQVSVVFQDYVRYDLTAHANIWLGNIDLPPQDPRIQLAAQASGADAVIQTLPDGYESWLGRSFHQGEELSGGQWQKIALARAFLRDSQLVVLDEPTSALDARAEEAIFENFRQLIKGRSAILISHRLSTVKMADRIYVMDQGQIIESGTHQDLIQRQGLYAELFELQAQPYRV